MRPLGPFGASKTHVLSLFGGLPALVPGFSSETPLALQLLRQVARWPRAETHAKSMRFGMCCAVSKPFRAENCHENQRGHPDFG